MDRIKIAILVDGDWFSLMLGAHVIPKVHWPTADVVYDRISAAVGTDEFLLKILYYTSAPFERTVKNPISGVEMDFSQTSSNRGRKKFIRDLGQKANVALRIGTVRMDNWLIKDAVARSFMANTGTLPLGPDDVYPNFMQKGVDMRIGIDIAILSIRRQVDRIVLFIGDTDLIPAIKLARREGIQVDLAHVAGAMPSRELIEHTDTLRAIPPA